MAVIKTLAELLPYSKVIIWFRERGVSLLQIKFLMSLLTTKLT